MIKYFYHGHTITEVCKPGESIHLPREAPTEEEGEMNVATKWSASLLEKILIHSMHENKFLKKAFCLTKFK